MIDRTKLQFLTEDAIDKIVADPIIFSETMTGPSGSSYATSDNVQSFSVPNPYGKRCLCRYRWSVDGVNFNEPGDILQYAFTVDATAWGGPVSDPIVGYQAAVAVGVSDSIVKVTLLNGYHGNVKYTGTSGSPGPDSYTGIAQSFTVEIELYEEQ